MNVSPEELFYASDKLITSMVRPTPETVLSFAPGKRYAIIMESLTRRPLANPCTIVELGCGTGEKLLWLKEQWGFTYAIGIDLRFVDGKHEIDGSIFLSANLNRPWPLEAQSVDTLVAMMLIEHLFDPYESFREIKRVLGPTGRAFINLPLISGFKNRLRLLAGHIPITSVPYCRWREEGHWDGFHLHYFTIPSIHDLANEVGLRICQIKSVGNLSPLKNVWPSLLCDEISLELRHSVS